MRKKKPLRRFHHTTNRLRVLRAARRWSQTEVARRLGYSTKFRYWQVENEETQPTQRERRRLAKIFGVTEGEIFPTLIAA